MRQYNDRIYVQKVLATTAGFFRMFGYSDTWLLEAAQVAVRNCNWSLALECLETFTYGREFHYLEADMINYVTSLIKGEDPGASYSENSVEFEFDLQEEELPL